MYIDKVHIQNFRILSNTILSFRDDLCVLIGKNNSGKTSFLVLFEKFLTKGHTFDFYDFSLSKRKKIIDIKNDTDVEEFAIRMVLNIKYDEKDNLNNLSEFILDLDPEHREVNILFECTIN